MSRSEDSDPKNSATDQQPAAAESDKSSDGNELEPHSGRGGTASVSSKSDASGEGWQSSPEVKSGGDPTQLQNSEAHISNSEKIESREGSEKINPRMRLDEEKGKEQAKLEGEKWTPNTSSTIDQQAPYLWREVPAKTLARVSQLYCKPNSRFDITEPCPRIVLIMGKEGSGRGFSASGVALEMRESLGDASKGIYRLEIEERTFHKNLLQILAFDEGIKQDSILIIDDLPSLASHAKTFNDDNLVHIEAGLERAGSYAIVCLKAGDELTEIPSSPFVQSLSIGYESEAARYTSFKEMLLKHLEFDAEYGNSKQLLTGRERKVIEQNASQIVKHFSSAPQIDYYLRAVSIRDRSKDIDNSEGDNPAMDWNAEKKDGSKIDPLIGILLSIASQIGRMRNTLAQLWFEQLTLNEKLFGMLVVLLRGMPCSYVQGIYSATVKRLRAENLPLHDGRVQGILDLQSRLQVEVKVDHAGYEFGNLAFSTELEGQIRNYRNLLDCVISVVFDVTNYPDHEVCAILGRVIARLSGDEWNVLRRMLDNWIVKITKEVEPKRQIEFLRIPAYALGELYFQGGNSPQADKSIRDLIVDTLTEWLDRFFLDQSKQAIRYDLSYAFVVMMSIAECFNGLAKSSPGGVSSESKDYAKLLRLLNRTVRWNFPWVFFPAFKNDASAVVANINLPFSDAFQYNLKLMGDLLPKQFVELVKEYSSLKKEDLDNEQLVAEDENQPAEKPVANLLNLGEEFNQVILGGIIRKMALELWVGNEKARVFDNPSFQWLLDLAAAMYSTETIEYDLDSLAIDADAIRTESVQQTTEEDYRRAVQCTVQWMNQCDTPRSRERCERWFSEVIQQCSFPQRRKLAKHLKQHHLAVSSSTRDLCDSLLTRMQVLDGQPVDPSEETFGLLLTHGHASGLNRLKSFAKNVQYQIGYVCPLKTGFLGDLKLSEMSNSENQKSAFEGVQSRPAIIMPLLENLNWVHVQYVAVLCAAGRGSDSGKLPIADIGDFIERGEMRREKVFVVSNHPAKKQAGDTDKSENKVVSFYSIPFERTISYQDGSSKVEISVPALRKIEYEVSKRVRADLLGRSVERFTRDLHLTFTGNHEADVKSVVQQLTDVVSEIQGIKDFIGGTGLYRRFSGLLQLLRILDLKTCCQQIQTWLSDRHDSVTLELGKGAVLFLIRAAKWCDYQELKNILPILRLWRCLWNNIDSCEQEAKELISLALWTPGRTLDTDLESKAEFDIELDEMLATLPRAWRPGLLGLVEAFEKSEKTNLANTKAKVTGSSSAVRAMSDQEFETIRNKSERRTDLAKGIRTDILLGRRRTFSVEADQQYLPILFDTSSQNRTQRLELCAAYYDLLRKQLKSREITPLVFRIGMIEPVCVGGGCIKEILAHPDLSPRVNIAMPILDLFQEEQLQSVVIFGRKLPYDIAELSTGKTASCFFVADQPQNSFVGRISCISNVYTSYNSPKDRAKFLIEQTVLQSH